MNKLRFKYNTENHFLKVETHGSLFISDFNRVILEIYNYAENHPCLKVLFDITESNTCISNVELDRLILRTKDSLNNLGSIRIAKIIAGHREAALGILFRNDTAFVSNLEFEIFSTRPAALSWLNLK